MKHHTYDTVTEATAALAKRGYTTDFELMTEKECLVCHQTNTVLQPEDFQIDKVYRFEGASNPEDQSILYAISSSKFEMRGTLVNGYGISSDEQTSKLIEKLMTNKTVTNNGHESNDTKFQRPEEKRDLNAPLIELNLTNFIYQLKNETAWTNSDRNAITIFKSDTMRIVLMGLHQHAELKAHKANGVISVQVLEGKVNFTTEQQQVLIEKGQMITLQANIMHSVSALTESFFLLTLATNKA